MNILLLTKSSTFIIGPVASLLGYIMDFIFNITEKFGIVNIGLSIIIFTILINIIMLPLTINQQKSSKLMSVMQPELKKVQDKYKGKKDQESMMKQQNEMRAVYEKYGTSMSGGCLPMLIQLPILFALYQVIMRIPAYVSSVRHIFDNIANPLMLESDYINKISDIATRLRLPVDKIDYTNVDKVIDLLYKFTPENFKELINLFPNLSEVLSENLIHINKMNMFFGMNLAVSPWQGIDKINLSWIIPILAGLTQWYSTKLMMKNQPTNANSDSDMAKQMQSMNNIMPLMSVWFCFTLPAGVGLYWIVSAIARIGQQIVINRHLDKIDVDELVKKNLEKSNAKRIKRGLAPQSIDKKAIEKAKKLEEKELIEEELKKDKMIENAKNIKDSSEYYNKNAKPGSLASKANMVTLYNEKNNKKK